MTQDLDDSLDLSVIEATTGQGNPGDIFNDAPSPAPAMTLAEQLAAQGQKLKPISDTPPAAPVEKPASQMTLAEQLAAQATKLKKIDPDEPPKPVNKPAHMMTLAEQLQAAQAKMKKVPPKDAPAPPTPKANPEPVQE